MSELLETKKLCKTKDYSNFLTSFDVNIIFCCSLCKLCVSVCRPTLFYIIQELVRFKVQILLRILTQPTEIHTVLIAYGVKVLYKKKSYDLLFTY